MFSRSVCAVNGCCDGEAEPWRLKNWSELAAFLVVKSLLSLEAELKVSAGLCLLPPAVHSTFDPDDHLRSAFWPWWVKKVCEVVFFEKDQ